MSNPFYNNIPNLLKRNNPLKLKVSYCVHGVIILACGTCIKSRDQEGTEMCPINTMKDMYEIIKERDKVVTF